jgi:DNA mismatch repair ATPase MutS
MCRPNIVSKHPDERSYSRFYESTLFQLAIHNPNFITNNILIGGDEPSLLLLTGANMGGKSTTMRQLCINTILG